MRTLLSRTLLGAALLGGISIGLYAWNNSTYADRDRRAVARARYVERTHRLASGTRINYAEGPANGPSVVLIHGQGSAWESFAPVLPELATDFHVVAIDVAGHGSSSRTPGRYDVHSIGAEVAAFIHDVIGGPVILAGHSSGGLIAAWVAAREPACVSAVLFEDPPLFSTDPERMPHQFNFVDLAAPAHTFLGQTAESDFVSWYIAHSAWVRYFRNGREGIIRYARNYRRAHPDDALTIWFLPPSVNKAFQFMHEFDPEFADAFYRLDWQRGFHQQEILEEIAAPATLIHANWRITPEGILEGAMTDEDASRAGAALRDCRIERVDTGHSVHDEDPRAFIRILRQLAARTSH